MGLLDRFKKERTNEQVGVDPADGSPLYEEGVISFVKEELERRKREKQPLELQWQLNANFVAGNQYCDINTYTQTVEDLPKLYDWTQREVYNRMGPIYETRLAKLGRIKPAMTVRPCTNELDDAAKAEVATSLLRGTQISTGFSQMLSTVEAWLEICGTVFFLSWWDTSAGRMLCGAGENGRDTPLYEGNLGYGLLTPYEVFPDSVFCQELSDCNSIIVQQVKTTKEIYDLYGVRLDGRKLPTFCMTPVPNGGGMGYEATISTLSAAEREGVETVTTYMERPGRDYPDGRMIVILGEDKLYYYGPLPYEVGEDGRPDYPLVKAVSVRRAGQFFGGSVYERLIPVQRAYNAVKNRKHDYLNRAAIGSWQVEEGSMELDELEADGIPPGKVVSFRPGRQGLIPLQSPPLPGEFENEETRLQKEFEYLSGISEMAVISATPAGMTSGKALEALKETDDTRLSLTAENIRNAVIELSKQWLRIYKQFSFAPRILRYTGSNDLANVLVWNAEDITSFDVVHDTENELSDTITQRRQTVLELLNSGLLTNDQGVIDGRTKRKVLEMLKLGNWEDAGDIQSLHESRAQGENVHLECGVVPEIREYDDHTVHIDEHNRFRLQTKFAILERRNPRLAEAFHVHIRKHEAALAKRAMVMQEGGGGQ